MSEEKDNLSIKKIEKELSEQKEIVKREERRLKTLQEMEKELLEERKRIKEKAKISEKKLNEKLEKLHKKEFNKKFKKYIKLLIENQSRITEEDLKKMEDYIKYNFAQNDL